MVRGASANPSPSLTVSFSVGIGEVERGLVDAAVQTDAQFLLRACVEHVWPIKTTTGPNQGWPRVRIRRYYECKPLLVSSRPKAILSAHQ